MLYSVFIVLARNIIIAVTVIIIANKNIFDFFIHAFHLYMLLVTVKEPMIILFFTLSPQAIHPLSLYVIYVIFCAFDVSIDYLNCVV